MKLAEELAVLPTLPLPENPALAIRSYVLRQGRMTKAQQRAWEMHAERYVLGVGDVDSAGEGVTAGDIAKTFGRTAPLVVEIGSGFGEAAAQLAAAQPQWNILAVEVHAPGIGALLQKLAAENLDNVRILRADALRALPLLLTAGSVARFNIFFPDPWHKTKHHKRRLIRPAVVAFFVRALMRGGGVHVVTDCADYARAAEKVLAECAELHRVAEPPPRPMTGYERRARSAGRGVTELYFEKGD